MPRPSSSKGATGLTLRWPPSCANLGPVVTAVSVVLGALLCVAVGVIVVLAIQLNRTRDQVAELGEALEADPGTPRSPRASQAAQAAGLAMRTAVETVNRMREQGFRSTLLASIDDFTRWAQEDGARSPGSPDPTGGDDLLLRHRELHCAQLRAR